MAPPPLLDTNILLRHLLQDHPDLSPRASAYLRRVADGELSLRLPDTVLFETVYTLERFYEQPRPVIRDSLLFLLRLPGLLLPGKDRLRDVFDLYVETRLSFADSYHAVLAIALGAGEIVSFDRGFDRVRGLRRIEPQMSCASRRSPVRSAISPTHPEGDE